METGIREDVQDIVEGVRFADGGLTSKIVLAVIAVIIALLSFFVVADLATSTDSHSATIASLDQKKGTVMGLVAASTAASAAVSLLPGDAGTPIAEKLVDLSSDFLIVVSAIYLEKYLLTTMGFAAFKILIPLSCVLLAVALFVRQREGLRQGMVRLSAKLALFGLALFVAIPASVAMSGMIESTYQESIDQTVAQAEQTTQAIEEVAEEEAASSGAASPLEWIADLSESVTQLPAAVSNLTADAQNALNGFIEALAVMIVTSCIIPILVLVFFLWLASVILGIDVSAPAQLLRPRTLRHMPRR